MEGGVTKMFNENILVYVKPIPEFFTGEHTPLICWKGSGYHFEGIKKSTINGREIYTGNLVKPGAKLFTAWWYENGSTSTIDQLNWRMRMLRGEKDFCLINVTAENESALVAHLQSMFRDNPLTILP
jgi:exosortase N